MGRRWTLSTKVVVAYSALIALMAGVLTTGLYWQFRSAQRLGMRDRLLELLNLAAPQIDSDYHSLTVTPADANKPFYTINVQQLKAIQAASPSINRIYTFRRQADGQFTMVLDCPDEDNPKAQVGEPLQVLTPVLLTQDSEIHQSVVESDVLPNADGRPVLYGYTPIKDLFGRVEGILAIELDASTEIQHEMQVGMIALIIFLVILGCTVLLVEKLSRSLIVSPILRLNQAAKQLADGHWEQTLPSDRADELGELAKSFNHMAQQLQTTLQQLETYSQTLEEKVIERTQQLEAAKGEAEINSLRLQETLDTLKWTQSQLVHTEKMSGLGQLVAGVAHEINNPINFIYGNLRYAHDYMQGLVKLVDLYQHEFPEPPASIQAEIKTTELDYLKADLQKLFTSMRVGVERIRAIILSLRNFSRLDESGCKPVDIHEGIESTLMILQSTLNTSLNNRLHTTGIEVIRDYGQLPHVECYAKELNQVFMNLITNAIDALKGIGSKLSAHNPADAETTQSPPSITIRTETIDADWVRITIADNGPGIPDAVRSRIFDPFFTTKDVGKGTGLGLSISYNIVAERHGGKLYCHSSPGLGSEFMIEIPVRLAPANKQDEA